MNRDYVLAAYLALTAIVFIGLGLPARVIAQEPDNLLRLQCHGTEKSTGGYRAQSEKIERIVFTVTIDLQTGIGAFSGLMPLARVVSEETGPYRFEVTEGAFLWGGKGTSKSSPISATSEMKIDRYSGDMTLGEVIISTVPGREYILLKNTQASCIPLTTRQF